MGLKLCTGRGEDPDPTTTLPADEKDSSTQPSLTSSTEVHLCDLAIEITFPLSALFRLPDNQCSVNEATLRDLMVGGEVLRGESRPMLIAGSQAEGLAVERRCGHGLADTDFMKLYGGDLAVDVAPLGQLPTEGTNLAYRAEGCPAAYSHIEVLHEGRLLQGIRSQSPNRDVSDSMVRQCVCDDGEGGRKWLQSCFLLQALSPPFSDTVQGPSAVLGSLADYVTGLVCVGHHPEMDAYYQRQRTHWPSPAHLRDLLKIPMLLVCVGPTGHADAGSLYRVSWSPHEMWLFSDLVMWMKHGYVCFKYVLKSILKSLRASSIDKGEGDGRSLIGSYHIKTVFLRHLEKHPPQPKGSPFQLVLDLCLDMQQYLEEGQLPHYFLPTCDLLHTVGEGERLLALRAVDKFLTDPLAAIICSASEPERTFGSNQSLDRMLRCFNGVVKEPACEAKQEDLQHLLCDLDEHREQWHGKQLRGDTVQGVSGRPELVRLAGYLQRNVKA